MKTPNTITLHTEMPTASAAAAYTIGGAYTPGAVPATEEQKRLMAFTKDFLQTIDKPTGTKRIVLFFARLWDKIAYPYRKRQAAKFQRSQAHREAVINAQLRSEARWNALKNSAVSQSEVEAVTTKFNQPDFEGPLSSYKQQQKASVSYSDDMLIKHAADKLKY